MAVIHQFTKMRRTLLKVCAKVLGFEHDPSDESEIEYSGESDWDDENPGLTILREQLEFYFSDANLEKDKAFREEIEKNGDRYVPVTFILNCNRIKQMEATADDILEAANRSKYLDADMGRQMVRSKEPFHHDDQRPFRTIRVTGMQSHVPQYAQEDFYQSIFTGHNLRVNLLRHYDEQTGEFIYTGTSLVELDDTDLAKEVAERKIEYGSSTLDVELLSEYQSRMKKNANDSAADTPKKKGGRTPKSVKKTK